MKKSTSILLLAFSAFVQAQDGYRVTDLGTFGGDTSFAYAISPSGLVAGAAYTAGDAEEHGFLYAGGVMTDLGTTLGGTTVAYGVNDAGQVVGYSGDGGAWVGFLYSNGVMQGLNETSQGFFTIATGISGLGEIVGRSEGKLESLLFNPGSLPTNLRIGWTSEAFAVNDSGQIVGEWTPVPATAEHAYLDTNGTITDLGTLGGAFSEAFGINASGQITGVAGTGATVGNKLVNHAFLYSGGVMTDLGSLGGLESSGYGINGSGQVVGQSDLAGGGVDGFLFSSGAMIDLNSLLDSSGQGVVVQHAWAINDNRYIAADGTTPTSNGNPHALLLTPYFIELPGSYSIFRGVLSSGTIQSLYYADGDYLKVLSGPTLSPTDPPVSVIVNGTSGLSAPSDLRLTLVAHANTPGLTQKIELWDFQAAIWVTAGTKPTTTVDSTEVAIASSPGRFVQAGTNAIKARVSWRQSGPTLLNRWMVSIDQVVWDVSP
ncbi:MAG TPA: hypothetical protein VKT78_07595 [Fimbriimonadaceae bacterium]|nr:hypothetical protein [Fimbriimonadaceae bacterium]